MPNSKVIRKSFIGERSGNTYYYDFQGAYKQEQSNLALPKFSNVDTSAGKSNVTSKDLNRGYAYLTFGPIGYQSGMMLLVGENGSILYAGWAGNNTIRYAGYGTSGRRGYGSDGKFQTDITKYDYTKKGGPCPPGEHDVTGKNALLIGGPLSVWHYPNTYRFGWDDNPIWESAGAPMRTSIRIHGPGQNVRPNIPFYTTGTPGSLVGYPTQGCIIMDYDELNILSAAIKGLSGGSASIKKFIVLRDESPVDPDDSRVKNTLAAKSPGQLVGLVSGASLA